MLDAATGKSVWASLGKLTFQFSVFLVSSLVLSFRTQLVITFTVLLSQLCRTAQKAPTGTRGTRLCTVKISCDFEGLFFIHFHVLFLQYSTASSAARQQNVLKLFFLESIVPL